MPSRRCGRCTSLSVSFARIRLPVLATADTSEPKSKAGGEVLTNRQAFEKRIEPPICFGCHSQFDTIGYGLENYNGIGAFRTTDNGQPVDARGTIKGTDVDGPFVGGIELSTMLAGSQQVNDCVVNNWHAFALGRELEKADACETERLRGIFEASGGDVRALLVGIVNSPTFVLRALPETNALTEEEQP